MSDQIVNAESIRARWDDEYRGGRYEGEAPLPFVREILGALHSNDDAWKGAGLYVGCGNGRNYLPLVDAGARLHGIDISGEAIQRLRMRRPGQALPLAVADFRSYEGNAAFDYLIAIQVFQHGDEEDVSRYFVNAAAAVRTGGLFFLRVNSASTHVYHRHTLLAVNRFGGFTIRYQEGPKTGLSVHFYSREELTAKTDAHFEPVRDLREDVIHRAPPKTGSWAQWEGVWKRRE
jgi:predicted TPR repeat methyltransferase